MIDPTHSNISFEPDPKLRDEVADGLIQEFSVYAAGAGIIPIPGLDLVTVSAVQVTLVKKLCQLHGREFRETQTRTFVSVLAGSVAMRVAAEGMKLIPVVGTILGGAAMSLLSGATTYAIGRVFHEHFSGGGTLANFDAEGVKAYFAQKVEEGKAKMEEFRKKAESFFSGIGQAGNENRRSPNASAARLEELHRMMQAGVLTEDEYNELKKKILSQQ